MDDAEISEQNDLLFGNMTFSPKVLPERKGSSFEEVFYLLFIGPAASLVMSSISFTCAHQTRILFSMDNNKGLGEFIHAAVLQFILLMGYTIWSNHLMLILSSFCCVEFFIICFGILNSRRIESRSFENTDDKKNAEKIQNILEMRLTYSGQIPFITNYRGELFLLTAIAILGVDFKIFPIKFAKTTSFGWSIMDCGVGCFIVTHGICSSQARGNYRNSVKRSIVSSLPLLLLGFMRLTALSLVDYHTSVPEYGVHWNFFFTLSVSKMISSLLLLLFSSHISSGLMALCIVVIHQWFLSSYGIADMILNDNRENLFMENKEGICSLPGFVAIYLAGVELGKSFWKPRCKMKDWLSLFGYLVTIGCTSLITMHMVHYYLHPTSRRMANMAYCIWMICISSFHVASHLALHLILAVFRYKLNSYVSKSSETITLQTLTLYKAINYNGLFHFLLTNIMTGFINLSIDTQEVSEFPAVCILAAYICISSFIMLAMMKFSIQLKFW